MTKDNLSRTDRWVSVEKIEALFNIRRNRSNSVAIKRTQFPLHHLSSLNYCDLTQQTNSYPKPFSPQTTNFLYLAPKNQLFTLS